MNAPIIFLLDPRLGDEQDAAALAAKVRDAREKREGAQQ